MKLGVQFDESGNFVSDFLTGMDLPQGHALYEGVMPNGLYQPKLVNGQVVEGLTQAELDAIRNAPLPPDPDVELAKAIQAATTLEELKKALIGTNGNKAKVKGELK